MDPTLLSLKFSPGRTSSKKKGKRAQLLHDAECLKLWRLAGRLAGFSYKTGQKAG